MTKIRHRLAHCLGWNEGTVVSFLLGNGDVLVGFECSGCGEVSGVHRVPDSLFPSFAERP